MPAASRSLRRSSGEWPPLAPAPTSNQGTTEIQMKSYRAPDGTLWGVNVDLPGASNAMVIFRHPNTVSSRLDRYAWFLSHGPEARSVTARLSKEKVLEELDDRDVARLFRRSFPISRPDAQLPVQASN